MNYSIFQYHQNLAEHFKKQTKTWNWFASAKVQKEQQQTYKTKLLKNTYRLSPDTEQSIYRLVEKAKKGLSIVKPVTVYQELDSFQTNAFVSETDEEINIVLSGKLIELLKEEELLAVIAHELTHIQFYRVENGQYEITNRIIQAIANDAHSEASMMETARLYRLYMELYCDRGAYSIVQNEQTVIETLVKISTGLKNVSATNYLKQAKEIFETEQEGTTQQTHPESFIRALAIHFFATGEKEQKIYDIIDQQWSMTKLDLFKRSKMMDYTKKMIHIITTPNWIKTDRVTVLARQYFPSFTTQNAKIDDELIAFFEQIDDSIREYFSYILLDFSFADSSLELAPLGQAFQIAEQLNFHKTFRQILKKERKLTVKQLDKLIQQGVSEVSQLSESIDESILKDA